MFNKVSFIGAGSMAEAIISGIINNGFLTKEQIFVTNKNNQTRLDSLHEQYQIQCVQDKGKLIDNADIIILSMKPNDLKEAVQSIKEYIQPGQLIISVVAGISTAYISQLIDEKIPVIRAMPNTSASIGFSATAITKGKNVTKEHMAMSEALFNTIGITVIVNEKDMDIVTGVSGSGPAYIYYFVEAMEKAAIEAGLEKSIAKALITQTVIGAGEMLQRSGKSAESLRGNVTSPYGTTAAGIDTLTTYGFEKAVMESVKSAQKRSIELGKEF